MLVNNNSSNSPQFGALKLNELYQNGKNYVPKCFSGNHHYLELHKSSISQVDNPYDVVVSLLKKGSKKVMAKIVKPSISVNESPVVVATVYPRNSLLSRADENMSVIKRACEKANSFNASV